MAIDRPCRQVATPSDLLSVGQIADGQLVRRNGSVLEGVDADSDAIARDLFAAQSKNLVAMSAGMAVAIHSSGTGIVAASAADATKPAIGLIVADLSPGFATDVQTASPFALDDWTAVTGSALLTRGPYFLDPASPGMLTAIAPCAVGQVVQIVGYAVSSTILDISPAPPVLL